MVNACLCSAWWNLEHSVLCFHVVVTAFWWARGDHTLLSLPDEDGCLHCVLIRVVLGGDSMLSVHGLRFMRPVGPEFEVNSQKIIRPFGASIGPLYSQAPESEKLFLLGPVRRAEAKGLRLGSEEGCMRGFLYES